MLLYPCWKAVIVTMISSSTVDAVCWRQTKLINNQPASNLIIEDHEMCEETSGEWPQFLYSCHLDLCLAIKQQANINVFQWQQMLASVLLLCETVTIKTEKKKKNKSPFFFYYSCPMCACGVRHCCNVIWSCCAQRYFSKDVIYSEHTGFILLQTSTFNIQTLLLLIISLSVFVQ